MPLLSPPSPRAARSGSRSRTPPRRTTTTPGGAATTPPRQHVAPRPQPRVDLIPRDAFNEQGYAFEAEWVDEDAEQAGQRAAAVAHRTRREERRAERERGADLGGESVLERERLDLEFIHEEEVESVAQDSAWVRRWVDGAGVVNHEAQRNYLLGLELRREEIWARRGRREEEMAALSRTRPVF